MENYKDRLYSKWNDILEYVKTIWNINDAAYNTFLKSLNIYDVNNNEIKISINTKNPDTNTLQTKDFIERFYARYLVDSIKFNLESQEDFKLVFLLENELSKSDNNLSNTLIHKSHPFIMPEYTFDTFISGDENAMVYNACINVAENPGNSSMNPLFIYGNSGLGKTHLMHAIANYILDKDETKNVIYVTSETFTNEIIEAIRTNKSENNSTKEFRNKYRNADVLLIDDVQFIIGKDAVQMEFFNTFNELYVSGRQIVLSCDKRPRDLQILEDRMVSRFLSGLTVDVIMPTYETRMAILRQKAEEEKFIHIEDSILDYIANNVYSNIRELQGAMNKVMSISKLRNKEITLELAKEAIADLISPNASKKLTMDSIIECVCDFYHVSVDDVCSKKRPQNLVEPRHVCMYICHEYTDNTQAKIGEKIGKKDHSTVINAIKNISEKLKKPDEYAELNRSVNAIIKKLGISNS